MAETIPQAPFINHTGTTFSKAEQRRRQKARLAAWEAECRKYNHPGLEHRALQYARWLAERDGISIPDDAEPYCYVQGVKHPDGPVRKHVVAIDYTRHHPAQQVKEKVGPNRWRYREIKARSEVVTTIFIPNWDFVPVVTEQHFDTDEELRAAELGVLDLI